MNTNAKPATPLPWSDLPYKAGSRTMNERHKDDTYELHAANAYPRLVAALKDAHKALEYDNSDEAGNIDALLRELGEA